MKIKELTNAPQWLRDAVVQDEDVEIDHFGNVLWNRGTWLAGNFLAGKFLGGQFLGGEFRGGEFRGENITKKPISVHGFEWPVYITETKMTIGCQTHEHKAWAAFDDGEINRMDIRALKFWRKHGPALMMMCAANQPGESKSHERHEHGLCLESGEFVPAEQLNKARNEK